MIMAKLISKEFQRNPQDQDVLGKGMQTYQTLINDGKDMVLQAKMLIEVVPDD